MPLQRDEASLPASLPYWEVLDGMMVLKSGRLEVGLELRVPATSLYDDVSRTALHTTLMGVLRNSVPQGERLRLMIEAAPAPARVLRAYQQGLVSEHPAAHSFTEGKVQALEEARKRGQLIEYRAYLSCTLTLSQRRRQWASFTPDEFASVQARASEIRQKLFGSLDAAGFSPSPLLNQGLFELVYRYLNPGARLGDTPAYLAPTMHLPQRLLKQLPHLAPPSLRSQVLSSDLARRWDYLWFSGHFAQVVSMGNLPVGYTHTGMIGHLLTIPRLYWLVLDYVHEPYGPAVRTLMGQARRLYAATGDTGGLTDYADPSVRAGFQEMDEALTQLSLSGSHVYRVGLSLVLLDPELDGVRQASQETISKFAQMPGIQPVVESAGLMTQFLALAPLSGMTNERTYLTLEENATDFFPINAPWRGASKPVSLMWNRWDSLTALDPFDPRSPNWNAIVIGGSGSGKTFLVQSLLADLLRQDTDVIIVDRGYGYKQLVTLFGGQIIPMEAGGSRSALGEASGVSINPFDLPAGTVEPDDEKKAFLLALIRAMIPSQGGVVASVENAILTAAIAQAYSRATSERRINGEVERYFAGARLSDLARVLVTLEEIGERPASDHEKEIARNLALRLQNWTGDTPFGQFVDHPTTICADAPVVYYETTGLEHHPELRAVGTLLIADLVWKRVKRDPGRRKIVVFDEAWSMLKIPEAAAFIIELYRRFRRYNAAVYAVTQSLEDFKEAKGILQNTTYHYLLRLSGEDELVKELLNLTDGGMQTFRSLASRRGSFSEVLTWIRHEDRLEGDVMVIKPTPLEYWAFTTHANDMVERERVLEAHGGHLLPALRDLAQRLPRGVT